MSTKVDTLLNRVIPCVESGELVWTENRCNSCAPDALLVGRDRKIEAISTCLAVVIEDKKGVAMGKVRQCVATLVELTAEMDLADSLLADC